MSKKKRRRERSEKHLPYEIYKRALNQDSDAVAYIVSHYDGYINSLASKKVTVGGRTITLVDETLKKDLENHLVSAIISYSNNYS